MIVATRAARARGERRLPKFLFPTFPRRPEDVRKEEMKKQVVRKMKQPPSWARSWAWWKILHTTLWHAHKLYHMILFIRRGSASSSGCWNSQAECHDTTGVISRNRPSAWHSLIPHQTLPRAPKLDHGNRRRFPPLHRRLITLNLTDNSTLCTLPQDQRLPLVVDSWSCCIPSLLKWWATFLYGHFYMVIYIWSSCYVCKVSINIIKFIRESVLLKHR